MPQSHDNERLLVLSVDYELFGNGTGGVREHVVDPTERMARLCEDHGMPLTVFFEAEEYLAFVRHREELRIAWGYDPAELIREQIADLAGRGHDIQLHLHPQWHSAQWRGGEWELDLSKQTVDALFESQEEITEYIRQRKEVLETITNAGSTSCRVTAYRAGAFSAQPGRKLIKALEENGISIDSTVVKGLAKKGSRVELDYRNAPCARGPWPIRTDVAVEDSEGRVWEFPIYSVMRRRWRHATWRRFRAKFAGHVPKPRQKEMVRQLGMGGGAKQFLRFLLQPAPVKLDFHNVRPETILRWIRSAPAPKNGLPDVMVLIGHTKEHITDRPFARLLKLVAADPTLRVASFTEVTRRIQQPAVRVEARVSTV